MARAGECCARARRWRQDTMAERASFQIGCGQARRPDDPRDDAGREDPTGAWRGLGSAARGRAGGDRTQWRSGLRFRSDADKRADLMIHEMTLDEKIQLVHGAGWGVLRAGAPVATGHNGGAGFVSDRMRTSAPT